jgi:hypothetical protein
MQPTPPVVQGPGMTPIAMSGPIPTAVSAGQHTTSAWETPLGVAFVVFGTAGLGVGVYRRKTTGH